MKEFESPKAVIVELAAVTSVMDDITYSGEAAYSGEEIIIPDTTEDAEW